MPPYKKKSQYIPGNKVAGAAIQVYGDNKKISDDAKNRKYVGEKIKKLIKEGMSEEKIVEEILKDNIMEEFKYLQNINPDIRICVTRWVEDAIKRNNKREERER